MGISKAFLFLSILTINEAMGQVPITPIGRPEPAGQAKPPPFPFSSYELFTLTDLLIEITMRPCNFVNRPLMGSIKKFVMEDLTHIRSNEVQHPLFFSSYQHLVSCLGRVDEQYSSRKSLSKYLPGFYPRPQQVAPPAPAPRERRSAESRSGLLTPHNNVLSKGGSLYEEDTSTINIDLSFPYFFVRLHNIMINVCPLEELPSSKFMMEALNEIVLRIMSDRVTFKAAQLKYFHNTPILYELSECEKATDPPPPPPLPQFKSIVTRSSIQPKATKEQKQSKQEQQQPAPLNKQEKQQPAPLNKQEKQQPVPLKEQEKQQPAPVKEQEQHQAEEIIWDEQDYLD